MKDNEDPQAEETGGSTSGRQLGDTLAVLAVLATNKRWLIGVPIAALVVSIVIALLLPKSYLGTARVMPVQQNQSLALSLLSQIGGGGLSTIAGPALGVRNVADLYVAILKSRTIADSLIARFHLQQLYDEDTLADTRKALEEVTAISATRDGIIVIEVEDYEATRASEIANAYVEELENITQRLTISEAGVRRIFFERQLSLAKGSLAEAEGHLRASQERTGMLKLEEQGRAIIEAVAALRAQIAVKEVQLASVRSFATEANPEYRSMKSELVELRAQLAKLENAETSRGANILIPTAKVPEVGLEYIRKLREVRYQETLFELLAKQYELARIEEAREAVVIQVIDRAVPADKKHRPRRAVIVLVATTIACVLTILAIFLREAFQRLRVDPVNGPRLQRLFEQLRLRA